MPISVHMKTSNLEGYRVWKRAKNIQGKKRFHIYWLAVLINYFVSFSMFT